MNNSSDKNVPALRFAEFSDSWNEKSLVAVSKKIQDGTHFSPNSLTSGPYKYITSKNIQNGRLSLEDISFISEEEHQAIYRRCNVQLGDVLLTKDGASTGNACLNPLDEEFSLLSSVAFIRADNRLATNPFIFSLLISPRGERNIRIAIAGQAITRITLKKLKGFKFYFPTIKEQRKIAEFLGSVDAKLDALRRKRALLAEYKRGVMQKLFSQQIRFRQDDGRPFPDWEDTKLGDISKILRGSGLSKSSLSVDGKHECILYGELFRTYNEVIQKVISRTNDEEGLVSKAGDILMPTSDVTPDGLATASVLMRSNVKLGGDMNIIRLKSKINPVFMSYLLNTLKKEIMRLVTGTTIKHIYAKDIKGLRLSIPSEPKEQQKIADFLTAIDAKITAVDQQITHMETFKKGLLQQMFV